MRVGNNSCHGQTSCGYLGDVAVGNDSCNGYYSCYNSYAGVGDESWYVSNTWFVSFLIAY
jgi:hypothetical protein